MFSIEYSLLTNCRTMMQTQLAMGKQTSLWMFSMTKLIRKCMIYKKSSALC